MCQRLDLGGGFWAERGWHRLLTNLTGVESGSEQLHRMPDPLRLGYFAGQRFAGGGHHADKRTKERGPLGVAMVGQKTHKHGEHRPPLAANWSLQAVDQESNSVRVSEADRHVARGLFCGQYRESSMPRDGTYVTMAIEH